MATKTRLTLEEFLALPETEPPSEYFDGDVRQKVSPNIPHSALALELGALFREWARSNEPCLVGVEGRHIARAQNKSYLPDVHVTRISRLAGHENESPLSVAPDVAVEVLSPDDRPSDVLRKVDLYVELEIPVFLLVDPLERSIRVYRGGRSSRTFLEGDTLDLSPELPGFTLDVGSLFGIRPGKRE